VNGKLCGITGNNCVAGTSLVTTLPAANDGVFADHHICQDRDPEPIEAPFFTDCRSTAQSCSSAFTVRGDRTWKHVVDECDAMADENAIFNIDTFTDKRFD